MKILIIILICMIPGLIIYPALLVRSGILYERQQDSRLLKVLNYALRALFFSVFSPLLGILLIIAKIVDRQSAIKNAYKELRGFIYPDKEDKFVEDGRLKFCYMGGAGEIECHICGYKEYITSFLHGFGREEDSWCKSGYQCQECGKLTAIENDHRLKELPPCECGGTLSREEPLFCPRCRSFRLEYRLRIIT